MSRDAVAEINAPRQTGGDAVSVVLQPGQEASDAADCDSGAQRDGEQVAGPPLDAEHSLRPFDREQPADQAADHGLAAHQEIGIAPVVKENLGGDKPVENFAPDGRAHERRRDKAPAMFVGHNVATPFTRPKIDAEADEIGKGLENKMGFGGVMEMQTKSH